MDKAILMCRCSTDAQNYDPQISDLKKYALSKGISQVHIIATKESGFKDIADRDGWQEVKRYFEEHPDYNVLIATEPSRLGRRESAIAEIKEYIERNHKTLYIKDNDLLLYIEGKKQPLADIVFSILVSMATTEMSVKKERFKRAKKELNENGFSIVGKPLFGYRRVLDIVKKKNKFVVNDAEAAEIIELYNTYLNGIDGKAIGIKGLVLYAISKGMSQYCHSKRNVTKMLSESAYVGGVKEVRIKKKNPEYWKFKDHTKPTHIVSVSHIPYPAILTQELFSAVAEKKKANRTMADKSTAHVTILSKLIVCQKCGNFLTGDYRLDRKTATYRCCKHKGIGLCPNSAVISMPFIDSLIWCFLRTNIKHIIQDMHLADYDTDISKIQEEIKNCSVKIKALQTEAKSLGIVFKNEVKIFGIDEAKKKYDHAVAKIMHQIDGLNAIIASHRKKITDIENLSSSSQVTETEMALIEQDKNQVSTYIHMIVDKVVCYNSNMHTYVRVTLRADDTNMSRWIFADKRNTIHIATYSFSISNDFQVDTVDALEALLPNITLTPFPFHRLQVYDSDWGSSNM